jgi:glutamate-1-semialdehyde 2,1-aminomutase
MTSEAAKRTLANWSHSASWYDRARASIAGGVGHDVRFTTPFPLYVERAEGAYKWDVDGNRYIDYLMGNGAILLGHAYPPILEAVQQAIPAGLHFGNDHPAQVRWAELIQRLVPCAERVRFANSGSEADALACRIARGFTGRSKILRFEGHFHGWLDELVTGFALPFDVPASTGLPPHAGDAVVMIADNDLDLLESTLAGDPDIAAVILEGSGASWATVPFAPGFLAGVREVTRRHGILMIVDEVITGFRWAPGGAQERAGIVSDLSTHAKIIAGGLCGAAVCGRAEVMEVMQITGEPTHDRFERVLHYGTFNASPLSAAAGIACLEAVRSGQPQRHADAMAERLRDGMDRVLENQNVAGYVYGEASTFHIYLRAPGHDAVAARGHLVTFDSAVLKGMPASLINALREGFRSRGVELMSYNGGLTSAAHTEEDIDETVAAFEDLVHELVRHEQVATLG